VDRGPITAYFQIQNEMQQAIEDFARKNCQN